MAYFDYSSFGAMNMTWLAVSLLVFLAIYIYSAIAFMTVAKKTQTKNGWFAFIPILNFYLLTQMAGQSCLWTLMILAGIIPYIGNLALLVVSVWFLWIVAEKIRFPGWTSILMVIPFVNLIVVGMWAWSKR